MPCISSQLISQDFDWFTHHSKEKCTTNIRHGFATDWLRCRNSSTGSLLVAKTRLHTTEQVQTAVFRGSANGRPCEDSAGETRGTCSPGKNRESRQCYPGEIRESRTSLPLWLERAEGQRVRSREIRHCACLCCQHSMQANDSTMQRNKALIEL